VQADNLQARVLGHHPPFHDLLGWHFENVERLVVRRERERCDFDARVAEFSDCGKCVGSRPVAERFVANCELHHVFSSFEVRR
jgi:hypothetical protein